MVAAWEIKAQQQVLVGVLHTDVTTIAWSLGLRNLIVPGNILPVAGMPFDHARNTICQVALEQGYQYCLRGETLIETADGLKRIRDISEGEVVKTHLGRMRPVTKCYKRRYPQGSPLLWVKTQNSTIKCTPEHPFFISQFGGPGRFVRARDLRQGDKILFPCHLSEDNLHFGIRYNTAGYEGDGKKGSIKNGTHLETLPVTPDVARFLGLYMAEGCGGADGIHLTVGNHENELVDFISRFSQDVFGRRVSITRRWATTVSLGIRPLGKLFRKWFGSNAREKRVPDFVYSWNLRNKLRFLQGYFDGDGCVAKGSYVFESNGKSYEGIRTPTQSFTTASKDLVTSVQMLLISCGLDSRFNEKAPRTSISDGHEIRSGISYQCWLPKKARDKMSDILSATPNGDYLEIRIEEIQNKKVAANLSDDFVYNLEVEEDHSYIADCASVHNCFMLDSDVVPPRDAILRLMAKNQPFISGLYNRRSPPWSVPVAMKNGQWLTQFTPGSTVEVDLVGSGCLLLRRDFLEKIPPQRPGKRWFDWRVDMRGHMEEGACLSEDYTLCRHARMHGWKVLLDTSVKCKHLGYAESEFMSFKPMETTVNT